MDPETQTEQAPTASVQDRIASIFGEPETVQQEAPKTQPEEEPTAIAEAAGEEPVDTTPVAETFELEIDGEKFVLPKKLEKGFMQEKDYTQKSQTLAEQRKQVETAQRQARLSALQSDFQKDAAQELQEATMIDAVIKQMQGTDVSGMDLDKLIRHRMDLDNLKERRGAVQQTIDAKRQEYGNKQAQELAKLRTESLETIKKQIPGWTEATAKEIRSHALSEGYSEVELDSILDPRHAITLWKAQQFDKLKATAQKTVETAKTVKTTPSNPMPQQVKDKLAFRKEVTKHAPGSQSQQRLVKDRIAKIFG